MVIKHFIWLLLLAVMHAGSAAANDSPWGGSKVIDTQYKPQKVVYDVAVNSVEKVTSVLDRASYLSKITGADPFDSSIILVLHGSEIDYFSIKNYNKHKALMQRAQSLVESEVLKIRMCRIAAQGHGYEPEDIHGFVEMVPMGDAEIIRLQNEENHAYMR
jgi:intracellular sulfur oxidation DsrE/DsrF family protein